MKITEKDLTSFSPAIKNQPFAPSFAQACHCCPESVCCVSSLSSQMDASFCTKLPKIVLPTLLFGSPHHPGASCALEWLHPGFDSQRAAHEILWSSRSPPSSKFFRRVPFYLYHHRYLYSRCFSTFAVIHKVIQSVGLVKRITKEMIEDFNADGVAYLEIRTTPKVLGSNSKSDYIESVLEGIAVISW